jgi:hypothetical protein
MTVAYTKFKGVSNPTDPLLMNELETSLKMFIDWGMLAMGLWTNVAVADTSIHDADMSVLKPVDDPSYTYGQVWVAFRKDFVWESDIPFDDAGDDPEPVVISAVNVNGSDVTSGFIVDYPSGRIIFDTAIPTTSTVKLAYSYRYVQVYSMDDAGWWRELQFKSLRADNIHFTQLPGTNLGDWTIGSHHRVQMPCVIIEVTPRASSSGYELGNTALVIHQDVQFHIMAENGYDRNKITDILRLQDDLTMWIFDSNEVATNDDFPLDYRGMKVNSNTYPDLVDETTGHRWKTCRWTNTVVSDVEMIHPNLFEGTVTSTCDVVYGTI